MGNSRAANALCSATNRDPHWPLGSQIQRWLVCHSCAQREGPFGTQPPPLPSVPVLHWGSSSLHTHPFLPPCPPTVPGNSVGEGLSLDLMPGAHSFLMSFGSLTPLGS